MARTLLDMKADILKAVSHPTRLAVVELLGRQGERCVCEIAEVVGGGDRTTLSKHLAILKAAGMLNDRKEGLKVFYSLNCPCVMDFFSCVDRMVKERVRGEVEAIKAIR